MSPLHSLSRTPCAKRLIEIFWSLEMVQWLWALSAPSEGWCSDLSTRIKWLTNACNSRSMGSDTPLLISGGTCTHMHINTQRNKMYLKMFCFQVVLVFLRMKSSVGSYGGTVKDLTFQERAIYMEEIIVANPRPRNSYTFLLKSMLMQPQNFRAVHFP